MDKNFGFIVDTNSYSGNFERQMCAYMTGHIGDCQTGYEEMGLYYEDGFYQIENVIQVADENDYERPVEIHPTPNYYNNGLGFSFIKGEEALALEKYKEYVRKYKGDLINLADSHRGKNLYSWTEEAINTAIERYKQEIDDAEKMVEVNKNPSYQSVLIHFSELPLEEVIRFMKDRAYKFTNYYYKYQKSRYPSQDYKEIEIIGFRLYTKSMTITESYIEV